MPYVKRDAQGTIVGLAESSGDGFSETLSADSPEIVAFLGRIDVTASIGATDQDFVRVLEDVVELLVAKGVILFTELPESAQHKVMLRQQLRSELGAKLDLIGED
ncbi:MAG: hypothetical protein V7746_16010 [Halioglobus sp.]